jgi:diadenosine tetraphosphatase ApaH/serine/threonine PP2A family protein phosphatase
MKAILSDIHGNLEALQAVLDDAARQGATEIYCLGNVCSLGGPNPYECADLALAWSMVLLGNHDQAMFADPSRYPAYARNAFRWAAAQIEAPIPTTAEGQRRRQFLEGLPRSHQVGDWLFVHGSPRNPIHEFVQPENLYNAQKMAQVFAFVERYGFVGRTRQPGILTEDRRFIRPDQAGNFYRLDGRKTIVNVGSVGQPRDGDPRACYALLDGDTIRYRRVEYDVQTTIKKIHAIPDLDNSLGDRLRTGR